MKTHATPDDWAWFSATGRRFRAREANDIEWSNFDPDALMGHRFLTVVIRRDDGGGVVVATESPKTKIRSYTDDDLACFNGILNAMVTPIDLDALKIELEASDGMA